MPGGNCSIFGCNTSGRHKGIAIFKLPKENSDLAKETRNEWVRIITKHREVDKDLRRQIREGNLHICEKHFEKKCINESKFLYLVA